MDDDIQPTIAIIGGGPVGIEAALYARYLGYPVTVYEAGQICEHVRQWGHVQLFSPFELNSSPLGLSALTAKNPDPDHPLLDPQDLHTGLRWVESYLEPLANSDLIRRCFKTNTRVMSVARDTTQINEETTRNEVPFRIMIQDQNEKNGIQSIDTADIVIDATGTWGHPKSFGIGGMPALGEQAVTEQMTTEQVDTLDNLCHGKIYSQRIPDLRKFKPTGNDVFLVVGRGYSAATNVMQIKKLNAAHPAVRCIWLTRNVSTSATGPMNVMDDDPLPYRKELSAAANDLALNADWLEWRQGLQIKAIEPDEAGFNVTLSDNQKLTVNHLLANTGFHGDYQMLEPLQVHRCYASGGPMAWAASVAGTSGDCLQQQSSGPDAIKTTEPDFYIIGSKAYGSDPRFLFATGLQQIRDMFKLVADRDNLDLYATMKPNVVGR